MPSQQRQISETNGSDSDGKSTELKPFRKLGSIRIIHVTSNGQIFVVGPHWPFAVIMLLIHLSIAGAFSAFLLAVLPWPSIHFLGAILALGTPIVLFVFTVIKDPGILLQSSSKTSACSKVSIRRLNEIEFSEVSTCEDEQPDLYGLPIASWIDQSGHLSDESFNSINNDTIQTIDSAQILQTVNGSREMIPASRNAFSRQGWCQICDMIVPNKAYHCTDCNVCIHDYDHHCPWTSKCIGSGNIVVFYSWIASTVAAISYMGIMGVRWCPDEPI